MKYALSLLLTAITAAATPCAAQITQQLKRDPNGAGDVPPWQAGALRESNFVVNASSGNLHFSHAMPLWESWRAGLTPRMEFAVVHNSASRSKAGDYTGGAGFGPGWSHSYGARLDDLTATTKLLTMGDGMEVVFTRDAGGNWSCSQGFFLGLTPAGSNWHVTDKAQWVWEYLGDGKLSRIIDSAGNDLTLVYDGLDRIDTITEGSGRRLVFGYRPDGRLGTITDADVTGDTWTFDYDAGGRLSSIADSNHGSLVLAYNADNSIQSFTDLNQNTWTFVYHAAGWFAGRVKEVLDPAPLTTKSELAYARTATTQTTTFTDRRNNDWSLVFDRKSAPRLIEFVDAEGNTARMAYNSRNKVTSFTNQVDKTWLFGYDANGNRTSITDPLGQVQTCTFDGINNLRSVTEAGITKEFRYDNASLPRKVTSVIEAVDGVGATAISTCEYNSLGLLERVVDPVGTETRFTYDSYGQLQSEETGPVGAGGTVVRTWLTGGTEAPEYVDAGRMSYPSSFPVLPPSPTQVSGRISEYGYSEPEWSGGAKDNFAVITVPINAGESASHEQHVTRDYRNRIASVLSVLEEANPGNPGQPLSRLFSIAYSDGAPDARIEIDDPDGTTLVLKRDKNLRPIRFERVAAGGGNPTLGVSIERTPTGRVRRQIFDDGSEAIYTYRDNEQVAMIEHLVSGQLVSSYGFQYDARYLLRQVSTTTPAGTQVVGYDYDNRRRLIRESRGSRVVEYVYDAIGNRKAMTTMVGGTVTERRFYFFDYEDPTTYDSHANRLVRVEHRDGSNTLTREIWIYYDNPFGHVSHIVRSDTGSPTMIGTMFKYANDGRPWLMWDEQWQLAGGVPTNVVRGPVLETRQTGPSRYLTRVRDGSTFASIYDLWTSEVGPIAIDYTVQVDPATGVPSAVVDQYAIAGLGRYRGGLAYYSHLDQIASVRSETSSGSVSGMRDYDAFGRPIVSVGSGGDFGFAGGHMAREAAFGAPMTASAVVSVGYRNYSPEFGRFLMSDPWGVGGGMNLFAYVTNQPTQLVDPAGLGACTMAPMYDGGGGTSGQDTSPSPDASGGSSSTDRSFAEELGAGLHFVAKEHAKHEGILVLASFGYLGATVGEACVGAVDLVVPGDIYDSGTMYQAVTDAIEKLWNW